MQEHIPQGAVIAFRGQGREGGVCDVVCRVRPGGGTEVREERSVGCGREDGGGDEGEGFGLFRVACQRPGLGGKGGIREDATS